MKVRPMMLDENGDLEENLGVQMFPVLFFCAFFLFLRVDEYVYANMCVDCVFCL